MFFDVFMEKRGRFVSLFEGEMAMEKEIVQNAGKGFPLYDPSDFDGAAEAMAQNACRSLCPKCGEPVVQTGKGRKKIFCSDACRKGWWNRQRRKKNRRKGEQ